MTTTTDSGEDTVLALTPRQEQLLERLAAGLSNQEIASELGITIGTVKQHLVMLYRRLGVSSRAKAVMAAGQWSAARRKNKPSPVPKGKQKKISASQYGWRMISVVAIHLPDSSTNDPTKVIARNHYLTHMRDVLERYANDLDGQFASMPYGGLLAWFGHPQSHADDGDRAVNLARYAHQCASRYATELGFSDAEVPEWCRIGVAVASQAEIVAHNAVELLGADGFRSAAILARYASAMGVPLADDVTRRIAPLSVAWMSLRFRGKQLPEHMKRLGKLFVVGNPTEPLLDGRADWGGLPFLNDILATARTGVAQWLSVECWPPTIGVGLTDALANVAATQGYKVIRLRLPSARRPAEIGKSILGQISSQILGSSEINGSGTDKVLNQETLVGVLTSLTAVDPVFLAVYGSSGIDRLTEILGVTGIETLVSKRVVLVANRAVDSQKSQTTLRLLGPRPDNTVLSRVFALKTPEAADLPDQLRAGLLELLDTLSTHSRALAISAATDPSATLLSASKSLNLTDAQIRACFNELAACGLIVPTDSPARFEFRSQTTIQAIRMMTVRPGVTAMSRNKNP